MVTPGPAPAQQAWGWFGGQAGSRTPYLPDLGQWYQWHTRRGSLPAAWQGFTHAQVAGALGVPAWLPTRPWRLELEGAEMQVQETASERVISYQTAAGKLVARWMTGPDGDWWQTEYPVKTEADLPAAHALVAARTYRLQPEELARQAAEAGNAGMVATELPMCPYSDLLHTLLGWGEGVMLLRSEGRSVLLEMLAMLDGKLQTLLHDLLAGQGSAPAGLPGAALAPDNLDGQYISPRTFREHLAAGYRQTAKALHERGQRLVVHAGGPVARLLPLLAEAGVDAVAGVAGPADAPLAEARAAAGPSLVLWGGIPQDVLLAPYDQAQFEAVVRAAAQVARADGRIILGIADHVPVDAQLDRLQAVGRLIAETEGA